jgi:hypothetical protein
MNDMMRRFGSFINFDIPLQFEFLSSQFLKTQDIYQKEFPCWNFAGTRKKLIVEFWIRKVLLPFSAILILAFAVTLPSSDNLNRTLLPAAAAEVISFFVLTLFKYIT